MMQATLLGFALETWWDFKETPHHSVK